MKKHSLTIILVSYNGSFWLKKTLTSLFQFYLKKTRHRVQVVLVDNASSDDSVAMTQANFPQVKVIAAPTNLGFAGANNLALQDVRTDYVMLLNTDTELNEQNGIDDMIDYLKRHQDVGLIGPRLLLTNGQPDLAAHRGEPTLWASFTYFLGLERIFPHFRPFSGYHRLDLDLQTTHQIDALSGAAMIFPRRALRKVGLLDDHFFLYAEDLDWSKRFRDAGYKVIYFAPAVITQHKNKSGIANQDAQIKGKSREYFYDTMLQYYDKHYAHKYPRWLRHLVRTFIFVKKEGFRTAS
jgi:GT2 family glycosyltransferase